MIKTIIDTLNKIKPYLNIYYEYKILVNLLALTSIYFFAIYFLVNPLYGSVDIYLEGFAATFALNSHYIYFIENILKLENNNYNILIITIILILTIIICITLMINKIINNMINNTINKDLVCGPVNKPVNKNFILPLAASAHSFMYNFYNNWNAGKVVLFKITGTVHVEKVLNFEEKFRIFKEWKNSNLDNININFENIEPLLKSCNDPACIIKFLNELLLVIKTNTINTNLVQTVASTNNWFYEHSTAILVLGGIVVSIIGILIWVSLSKSNDAAEGLESAARALKEIPKGNEVLNQDIGNTQQAIETIGNAVQKLKSEVSNLNAFADMQQDTNKIFGELLGIEIIIPPEVVERIAARVALAQAERAFVVESAESSSSEELDFM